MSKKKFAILSRISYETDLNKQKQIARNFGYEIDNEYSNKYHLVLIDKKNKDVIISFRGTNPTDIRDIKSDIEVARNRKQNDERFVEALDLYDKVKSEYSDFKFQTTGHSLGGGIAIYLNQLKGVDAYAFNPASSPFVREKKVGDNVIIYRNEDDVISSGYKSKENADNIIEIKNDRNYLEYVNSFLTEGALGVVKTLTKEQLKAHSLEQFEQDD